MRGITKLITVSSVALVAIGCSIAKAGVAITSTGTLVLAGASSYGSFNLTPNDYSFSNPGTYTNGFGSTATSDPSAGLVSASTPLGDSEASSLLVYQFSINGPINEIVPFSITANLAASGGGYALLIAYGSYVTETQLVACTPSQCGYFPPPDTGEYEDYAYPNSFSGSIIVHGPTNAAEYIEMQAIAASYLGIPGSASVDPKISISQSLIDQGFSVAVSPGVSNTISAIPEPATWEMMLIGFVGIGLARRRRATA
jgi:PEP-CTERM motif